MNTQAIMDEFLAGCNNPQGPVYKAMQKSFARGQVEMHAYAMRLGLHHNIDPRIFVKLHQINIARHLADSMSK